MASNISTGQFHCWSFILLVVLMDMLQFTCTPFTATLVFYLMNMCFCTLLKIIDIQSVIAL